MPTLSKEETALKIANFQKLNLFKDYDVQPLEIADDEWIKIIEKFEKSRTKNLKLVFFIDKLAVIRKVSSESLISKLSKPQPPRESKKTNKSVQEDTFPSRRRNRRLGIEDGGANSLIVDPENVDPNPVNTQALVGKLTAKGVRITQLTDGATPEKGYTGLKYTPGRTKAREICTIERGERSVTFFAPLSPYGDRDTGGRVDVSKASEATIQSELPQLTSERVATIEFTATRTTMGEREGVVRRQGQKTLTKASASDVFRAHDVDIVAKDSRHYHWAHLIAYFLGGPHDTVNLVASTAAANYTTLEAVELYIKKKLDEKQTDAIVIRVEPKYSGESLIPDLLIYNLQWQETTSEGLQKECKESFKINPQSYRRITKSMHQAIAVARDDDDNDDEKSDDVVPTTKI